jgi:energy-coupling factor transport system permease protein
MLAPIDLTDAQATSLLGRASPLVKLGLAILWLVGLALTLDPGPPLVLAAVVLVAGLTLGRIPPERLVRGLAPLVVAAASIATANLLFAAANTDPASTELARIGPLRFTVEAAEAAAALAARVLAIVSVGAVFVQTTDPTRLVDSLVQQARLPERFAYGALAAYQAVPRLGEDLATLRQARRIRGLGEGWHPRLLVGLLVRAIRHADQLALAMDARAFGSGPRTTFRPIAWGWPDVMVGFGGFVTLALMVALA